MERLTGQIRRPLEAEPGVFDLLFGRSAGVGDQDVGGVNRLQLGGEAEEGGDGGVLLAGALEPGGGGREGWGVGRVGQEVLGVVVARCKRVPVSAWTRESTFSVTRVR